MKRYLILISLILLCPGGYAKEDKAAHKNRKAIEREENQFQKDLRKNPNSAIPYLDHANNLAAINSESSRAKGFYELALKYDSANVEIFRNYGKYLFERSRLFTESKVMLEKGLVLKPEDAEMKKYLESANKYIAIQEEDAKMRDFGTTANRALNPDTSVTVSTKFDSLKLLTTQPGDKYHYQALLSRFLADDKSLTPPEMYMLIVGYSAQTTYNPFNYNEISAMKMLAGYNIDSAIRKGEQITEANPLNPSLNKEMMYYYRKKNEVVKAEIYLNRVKQFFNGVLYSGDGTCRRPYVSLWAKEEYNFITYLGYKSNDNHSMGMCNGQMAEVIDMTDPATKKTEQIYFNVALIYMQTVGK
jgi:Domain of unknown function (DUF4919)